MKNILPSDDFTPDKVDESAVVVPINKEQKLIAQLINRNQPGWELDNPSQDRNCRRINRNDKT